MKVRFGVWKVLLVLFLDAVTPSPIKSEPEIKIEMTDEGMQSPDFIDEKLTLKEIDDFTLSSKFDLFGCCYRFSFS